MIELTASKIEEFQDAMEADGMSPHTVRAYVSDLKALHASCGSYAMRSEEKSFETICGKYLNEATDRSPATIRRRMASFRRYADWQGHFGILRRYRAPSAAPPEPHPLPGGIDAVMQMAEHATYRRHKALIALCGLCGLRVGEALTVTPSNFIDHNTRIHVRGKGKKDRKVPVSPAAWKLLEPAIVTATELGTTLVGDLKDRPARSAISRIGKRALDIKVASHDLRATFATAAFQKCRNIRTVQDLLGHADSHTTETYIKVTTDEMADAADLWEEVEDDDES